VFESVYFYHEGHKRLEETPRFYAPRHGMLSVLDGTVDPIDFIKEVLI